MSQNEQSDLSPEDLAKIVEVAPEVGVPKEPTETRDDEDLDESEQAEVSGRVDEELDTAQDEAAREVIRERRRVEARAKKDRRRERENSQRLQIQQLTGQVDQLREQLNKTSSGFVGIQVQQVREAHAQAVNALRHFENAHAAAVTAGDGEAATLAMRNFQNAQRAEAQLGEQLRRADEYVRASATRNPGGSPTPQLNPSMVSHAKEFLGKLPWYKGPASNDMDTKVLVSLDQSLASEGWDPSTSEYWEELGKRGERYLPHRFGAPGASEIGYNSSKPRRQTTAGSGGNSAGGPSTGSFRLSTERVSAMKAGGLWEDPAKRKRAIDEYRKYDTANSFK